MTIRLPSSHIYSSKTGNEALSQGDVIFLSDGLKEEFLKHFTFDFDPEYLMVINQSCDLVKRKKRPPKISHIVLSLIRPFKNYISRTAKGLDCRNIDEKITLIKDNDYDALRAKAFDLINNANAKAHLFLPKEKPFKEHMTAIFSTVYSLRFQEQYDLLLQNRVLSLNNEYRAKIGDILSTLFDRVVVTEVADIEDWDKKKLYSFLDNMFEEYGLLKADKKVMEKFPAVGKITIKNAIQEREKLAIEIKEEEARRQLKNTLEKWKPEIVDLIKDCMKDNTLGALVGDKLERKLGKLFDQKIY